MFVSFVVYHNIVNRILPVVLCVTQQVKVKFYVRTLGNKRFYYIKRCCNLYFVSPES